MAVDEVRTLRAELKAWEKAFKAEHGRCPTKMDVDGVPDISPMHCTPAGRKYRKYQSYRENENVATREASQRIALRRPACKARLFRQAPSPVARQVVVLAASSHVTTSSDGGSHVSATPLCKRRKSSGATPTSHCIEQPGVSKTRFPDIRPLLLTFVKAESPQAPAPAVETGIKSPEEQPCKLDNSAELNKLTALATVSRPVFGMSPKQFSVCHRRGTAGSGAVRVPLSDVAAAGCFAVRASPIRVHMPAHLPTVKEDCELSADQDYEDCQELMDNPLEFSQPTLPIQLKPRRVFNSKDTHMAPDVRSPVDDAVVAAVVQSHACVEEPAGPPQQTVAASTRDQDAGTASLPAHVQSMTRPDLIHQLALRGVFGMQRVRKAELLSRLASSSQNNNTTVIEPTKATTRPRRLRETAANCPPAQAQCTPPQGVYNSPHTPAAESPIRLRSRRQRLRQSSPATPAVTREGAQGQDDALTKKQNTAPARPAASYPPTQAQCTPRDVQNSAPAAESPMTLRSGRQQLRPSSPATPADTSEDAQGQDDALTKKLSTAPARLAASCPPTQAQCTPQDVQSSPPAAESPMKLRSGRQRLRHSSPATPAVHSEDAEGREDALAKGSTAPARPAAKRRASKAQQPAVEPKAVKRKAEASSEALPRQRLRKDPVAAKGNFVRSQINGKGPSRRRFMSKSSRFNKFSRKSKGYFHKRQWQQRGNAAAPSQFGNAMGSRWQRQPSQAIWENDTGPTSDVGAGSASMELGCNPVTQHTNHQKHVSASLHKLLDAARCDSSADNLRLVLRAAFGYEDFRPGQLTTITNVLAEQSSMVVLPTGSGKSLCYQLPALLLPGIVLVVSPLVALMRDQLEHLPSCLPGVLLTSQQDYLEQQDVIRRLQTGEAKVLFVSPERLFTARFLAAASTLQPFAFVAVDEAHCVSDWSHNFRPAYLRLGEYIRGRIQARCVLALTATATKLTVDAVMSTLGVPSDNIIQEEPVRNNLHLSVSHSKERSTQRRLEDLDLLLKTPRFAAAKSIIVYCSMKYDTDEVADYLSACGFRAQSYHAEKSADERNRIQRMFCTNKLRVVVATVAFGMGLDKSDVGAVVHYNMPRSLESFVQEIGRAGRDGRDAHCHMFADDTDFIRLRSLLFSDGVEDQAIFKLLSKVFSGASCQIQSTQAPACGVVAIEATSKELDMREEVLQTMLSYLELEGLVRLLPPLFATCHVTFHKTPIEKLAKQSGLVAAVMQQCKPRQGRYTFSIPTMAATMGVTIPQLDGELKQLLTNREVNYETEDKSLCFEILKKPDSTGELAQGLIRRLSEVEACQVSKLDAVYQAVTLASNASGFKSQTAILQQHMAEYFTSPTVTVPTPAIIKSSDSQLTADMKVFIKSHRHVKLNARAIARIFQSLQSPAFPASQWCKNHWWGKYKHVSFHAIRQMAQQELIASIGRS
eukprot:jgi/Chlat1/7786/Chrsp66S07247